MPHTRFWLAVGTPENWHMAFDYGGIWGLRATQQRFWEVLQENADIVFFYVTSPVSGVVGYGIVRTKLHQRSPLWPQERAESKVIWPLRFEFDVLSAVPPSSWREQKIGLRELRSRVRSGFQSIEEPLAQQLLRTLPPNAPLGLVLSIPVGLEGRATRLSPVEPGGPPLTDPHGRTQWLLAEIGRLQKLVADTEYPMENRRLDVAWRRVQRSVPSHVFEVQVGGNLTEAMGKLKQAFDLWNSHIFLAAKAEQRDSANQLVGSTFHEVQHRLRFIELDEVEELYQRKRAYREFEAQLGLLT